ncbi:MAG: SprT family zinc-dependent metalloprotease [Alphaproteobacteria bacterium]
MSLLRQRPSAPRQTWTRLVRVPGTTIEIPARRSDRARRVSLNMRLDGQGVELVLPRRATYAEGLAFAAQHRQWITACLSRVEPHLPFTPGAFLPYLGDELIIRHCPTRRGGVWREEDGLMVTGQPEHLSRRVHDWLRREARREMAARAYEKAAIIQRAVGPVSVRDTRTRWGSCASDGAVSFCWRLIMAPEPVLDYVVAHEIAHLVEANHSDRFWRLCASLTERMDWARAWLHHHGQSLHRIG